MLTINIPQIAAILAFVFDHTPTAPNNNRKIDRIKAFRSMTGYGLWESKTLCEAEEERRAPPIPACQITKALTLIRDRQRRLEAEARDNPNRGY